MHNMIYVGIEISKESLTVGVRAENGVPEIVSFANDGKGRKAILKRLSAKGSIFRVVMESSGTYGLDLALLLHNRPTIELMVANGKQVRRLAEALDERSKNDLVDTRVLIEYGMRMPFVLWQPPSEVALELRGITRLMLQHTDECTRWKARLHAASATRTSSRSILSAITSTIHHHRDVVKGLQEQAVKIITADPQLHAKFKLLMTAKGIGEKTAVMVLGELAAMPEAGDPDQWVAHAGLDPREFKSGSSVDRKCGISKAGNKYIRRALYMSALVAARFEPNLRAFYLHLIANGKKPIQAIIAVMRKLLRAIWAMFATMRPFDGSRLYRPRETAPALALPNPPAPA
jgi:transposase